MGSSSYQPLLRGIADTNPQLRTALLVNDAICYVFKSVVDFIIATIVFVFKITYKFIEKFCSLIIRYLQKIPGFNSKKPVDYKRIENRTSQLGDPLPYKNNLFKRSLTYYGGITFGALLYLFVYYVLIKHHTYISISVAFLLMMAYLLILENSHNIRGILMLCLPIMFTNRGRAMVFCFMLALMLAGPLRNSRLNIGNLHMSINCCKQYLIVKTDKTVEENVVKNIVRAEDIVQKLADDIKEFARELQERSRVLIEMAITVERFITQSVQKLVEIVDVCNAHTQDVFKNCQDSFDYAYRDCKEKLGYRLDILCQIVKPVKKVCHAVHLPNYLCAIPRTLIHHLDRTIGERLRYYIIIIQNEFYVDIEIKHHYSYNGTKSKSYTQVVRDIKEDIKGKFWLFRQIARAFHLLSLILVVWIIITATLYHMHYLDDIKYDNIYLDDYLKRVEERRKKHEIGAKRTQMKIKTSLDDQWRTNDIDDEILLINNDSSSKSSEDSLTDPGDSELEGDSYLFPMTQLHRKQYFEPFSIWMNDTELMKLYIAGLVWSIINGYIFFFVLVDYALYQLIELIDGLLNDILFRSDLPLVDIASGNDGQITQYNRTYLSQMRNMTNQARLVNKSSINYKNGTLSAMYRRLMDSIEEKIPDDIAILDSLQKCLPNASEPNYENYKNLMFLAIFTFAAVIVEAYALRTRHCIANLYYPKRARKRAVWLYRKLISEKPKFQGTEPREDRNYQEIYKLLAK